jgi:exopolysaccharide production protein ExoQ
VPGARLRTDSWWVVLEPAFATFGLLWLSRAMWRLGWDPYGHERVFGVAAAALLWVAWRRREVWNALRGCWPALLPVALAVASIAWSIRPDGTIRFAAGLVATTCLGLFLATRLDLRRQVACVALVCGGIVAVGLVVTAVAPEEGMMSGAHAGAWRGLFFNRNQLAPVAVLGAVACALVAMDRPRFARLAWLGMLACTLAAAGSRSRGAWIVGPLALAGIPLLVWIRRAPERTVRRNLAIAAIALGVLGMVALPHLDTILAPLGRDHTLSGRTRIWEHSIDAVASRPALGYGYRAFWRWAPEAKTIRENLGVPAVHGHALWLDVALELGLVTLALFIAGIAVVAARTLRFTLRGRAASDLWPALCLGVLLSFSLLEPALFRPSNFQWALYVALAAVVSQSESRDDPVNARSVAADVEP